MVRLNGVRPTVVRIGKWIGLFRSLSALALVLFLLGSFLVARQTMQPTRTASTAVTDQDQILAMELSRDLTDRQNAQSKADSIAMADSERAKVAEDRVKKVEASRPTTTKTASPSPTLVVPPSCSSYSGNRAVGCALVTKAGMSSDQMVCLDKLFTRESQWSTSASNSSSGAYGIPQALPGSKMAAFGNDWRTNPATQIAWGLNYIKGRYSTPCGAWSHSQSSGWY
jgi:hypothetical protein